LFLGVSLFLWNCEKEEFVEEIKAEKSPFKLKDKTYAELTKTKKFSDAVEKVFKPQKQLMNSNYSSKTVMEEQYGFTIDSTIVKEISSEKYTSYTMFIHREEKDDSFYENLLVEIDSVNNVNAYILKYIKKSELIIHEEHGSFSQDVDMEVTRIEYNDTQAKLSYSCKMVNAMMCSFDYEHVAQNTCFKTTDNLFYGSYEQCSWSDDGAGGGGGGGGAPNTTGNTTNGPNPHGGEDGSSITVPIPCVENCEECSLDDLDNIAFSIGLSTSTVDCLKEKEDCQIAGDLSSFLKANNNADGKAFAKLAAEAKCEDAEIDWEDRIINKLTGKEKCVYDKIKELDLFKSTIKKFQSNDNYNLTIEMGDCDNTDTGCTDGDDIENGNITIIMEEGVNGRPLDFAADLLHEGIHAEIFKFVNENIKGIDTNDRKNLMYYYWLEKKEGDPRYFEANYQHQHMADKYITPLIEALMKLDDNNYTSDYYLSFAWSGLSKYGFDGYFENGQVVDLTKDKLKEYGDKAKIVRSNSNFLKNDCD
jgi:hypothetical protein